MILSRFKNGQYRTTEADPGLFLGGGAPLRKGVTNTNKWHFFAGYQLYYIESRRSSQGGGGRNPCTLPLDPPMDKAKYSRHNSTKYPVLVSLTGHTAEGPSILIDSIYIFSAIGFSNNFEYSATDNSLCTSGPSPQNVGNFF